MHLFCTAFLSTKRKRIFLYKNNSRKRQYSSATSIALQSECYLYYKDLALIVVFLFRL